MLQEHAGYVDELNAEHTMGIKRNRRETVRQSRGVPKGKIGEYGAAVARLQVEAWAIQGKVPRGAHRPYLL